MAITFVLMSVFNLLKCSLFLNSFELLVNRKKHTYLYGYCVYNQLQNKNHRCQCKQMHGNYFRITTTWCHLTAVLLICFKMELTEMCLCCRTWLKPSTLWQYTCTCGWSAIQQTRSPYWRHTTDRSTWSVTSSSNDVPTIVWLVDHTR